MDIYILLLKAEETRAVRSHGEKDVNCMTMEIQRGIWVDSNRGLGIGQGKLILERW